MPNLKDRPDKEFIDATLSHYTKLWAASGAQWLEDDSFTERTYPVWSTDDLNKTRPTMRPSTPTIKLEQLTSVHALFEPSLHREPVGDSERANQAKDRLEEALSAVMVDAADKETVLPWKQAFKHLLAHGYTIIEAPVYNAGSKPKEPKKLLAGETQEQFDGRVDVYKAQIKYWNPIRFFSVLGMRR